MKPHQSFSRSARTTRSLIVAIGALLFSHSAQAAATGVQYGSDLSAWSSATHGVNGVVITVTDDGFGSGVDKVEVSIPRSLAPNGKLFARLQATLQ